MPKKEFNEVDGPLIYWFLFGFGCLPSEGHIGTMKHQNFSLMISSLSGDDYLGDWTAATIDKHIKCT